MPKEKWIEKHKNETRTNNAGLKMTITNGTRSDNITVTFDDGSIVKNRKYHEFIQGGIEHPKGNWITNHINESHLNRAGLKMTITGGTKYEDINVTFEDGSIVKHRSYTSFKRGYIEHPKGNFYMKHINETRTNSAGLEMTITDVKTSHDITITFKDGSIVKHKKYYEFEKGIIPHPKGNFYVKHINETRLNNAGFKMTITNIKNSNDIDVTFENGSTVKHKRYDEFKAGSIQHPNGNWILNHINETIINKAGIKTTITDGRIAEDMNIVFEDGSRLKHKKYTHFIKRQIPHPLYPPPTGNAKPTEIGCITRKNVAYKTDTCHYYCTCSICQHDDIWDWKEIHEHNALHGIPKENLIFIEPDEIKDEKQPNTDKKPQS